MAEYKQPVIVPNADIHYSQDPNKLKSQQIGHGTGTPRVSAGDPTRPAKTEGVKIRGTGAATKGVKARGPLA